jgi:Raf kinase inhibitor-like YbhB/YbcL family protein
MRKWFWTAFLLLAVLAAALTTACASAPDKTPAAPQETPAQPAGTAGSFDLTSPAFSSGGPIPQKYTCQGEDISPALAWGDPPAGTKSFALIVDDPDAPGGTWVHWLVYNLPPETRELAEGASKSSGGAQLPAGAVQGTSSFKRGDYGGPCPPSGQHRYYFRMVALDTLLDASPMDKKALLQAMDGHILAQGEWMGVYQKQ